MYFYYCRVTAEFHWRGRGLDTGYHGSICHTLLVHHYCQWSSTSQCPQQVTLHTLLSFLQLLLTPSTSVARGLPGDQVSGYNPIINITWGWPCY